MTKCELCQGDPNDFRCCLGCPGFVPRQDLTPTQIELAKKLGYTDAQGNWGKWNQE